MSWLQSHRNLLYVGLFGLLACVLFGLHLTRSSEPRPRPPQPEAWTPVETLESFIEAQENGAIGKVVEFIVRDAREDYEENTRGMDHDDMVAAGLQFRQEQYRLEETRDDVAIFYSPVSALYLGMTREDGRWKIDPKRTDKLNKEN
jgi:hypothetical protein